MSADRSGLFWLCVILVAIVVVRLAARPFLSPREPKRHRWLPAVAAMVVLPLLACASAPQIPFVPTPDHHVVGAGWSDLGDWSDPSPQPT